MLNYKFEYLEPFYNFLSGSNAIKPEELISRISKGVKLDFLVIAGFFIKADDSRADLLIIGGHIKENIINSVIKDLEAEVGREINYAVFTTTEFKYRLGVFDKFIKDVLDYPHVKLVNKLGI